MWFLLQGSDSQIVGQVMQVVHIINRNSVWNCSQVCTVTYLYLFI